MAGAVTVALVVSAQDLISAPAVNVGNGGGPGSSDVTPWLLFQMKSNSVSPITADIRHGMTGQGGITGAYQGLRNWIRLVRHNSVWDFKRYYEDNPNAIYEDPASQTVVLGGEETSYQALANVHYGYVGRAAGIPYWFMQLGAGIFQIYDASKAGLGDCGGDVNCVISVVNGRAGGPGSFFDDPYDAWNAKFGAWLYNQYGSHPEDLTEDEFARVLQEYTDNNGGPGSPKGP